MLRAAVLATAALALVGVAQPPPAPPDPLAVGDGERLLVIAPHPDDETLGAGGLIQRVIARHGTVHVVLVTAGDGNIGGVVMETGLREPQPANFVAYGERRVGEARTAATLLGVAAKDVEVLGFPDGGLMPLLSSHWHRTHPERSATTGVSDPPYSFAVNPHVAYDGADLREELRRILNDVRPTLIALPDPLDRHPDHGASGILSLLAIDEWIGSGWPRRQAPRVMTYLVHWPDWPPGWNAVTPDPAAEQTPLTLPSTLPERPLDTAAFVLSPAEVATKRSALAAHASQERVMGSFLAAFVRRTEPFTLFDATEIRSIASEYERTPEQQVKKSSATSAG